MSRVAQIKAPKGSLSVRVADTTFSRAMGLMFRSEESLLLDFGRDSRQGIWMLFMRFPIDIVFISARGRVVHVVEDAPPVSLNPSTWRIYYPPRPVRFVLEVPAGTAGRLGLSPGERVTVSLRVAKPL